MTKIDNTIQEAPSSVPFQEAAVERKDVGIISKIKDFFGSYSKEELAQWKKELGIPKSELNTSQMRKIAVYLPTPAFKSDAERIQNLAKVLNKTEFSLSKDAHQTSISVGEQKRYFDAEGSIFAGLCKNATTEMMFDAREELLEKVGQQVKASDIYTMQKGNSLSSVPKIDYLVDGILGFARSKGLTAIFVSQAARERREVLDFKQSMEKLTETLSKGLDQGLISLEDPALAAVLEDAGIEAMRIVEEENKRKQSNQGYFGKPIFMNPDSEVVALGTAFKHAGLLPDGDLSRFIFNVHQKAGKPFSSGERVEDLGFTDIQTPVIAPSDATQVRETQAPSSEAEKQARTEAANAETTVYVQNLDLLASAQQEMLEKQRMLKTLLKIKAEDDLRGLSASELRAMIRASRATHSPITGDPSKENLDASIEAQKKAAREQFAYLQQIFANCKRPHTFEDASKEVRSLARKKEEQTRANDAAIAYESKRITEWTKQSGKVENKIDTSAMNGVSLALGEPTEEALPDFIIVEEEKPVEKTIGEETEAAKEKKPGFFDRLFSKKPKAVKEDSLPDFEIVEEEPVQMAASDDLPALTVNEELPPVQARGWFW